MCLVLSEALVGPKGGGNGQMAGELRQEPRVERRVLWDFTETNPRVQDGRSDRCAGVVGVGALDDPDVAAGDPHVVRGRIVRTRHRWWVNGVADDIGAT